MRNKELFHKPEDIKHRAGCVDCMDTFDHYTTMQEKRERPTVLDVAEALSHVDTITSEAKAYIVRAVNCHEELLDRVRLDGNAYHAKHAESVYFRECQNFECINYRRLIAKAEGVAAAPKQAK